MPEQQNTAPIEKKITKEMVENGELEVGDVVVCSHKIVDYSGKFSIEPGKYYTVVGIPNDSRFPGAFNIKHPSGNVWGFDFGQVGNAQYWSKIEMNAQSKFFTQYGEIPAHILSVLKERKLATLQELLNIVMTQKMLVPPDRLAAVKREVEYSINALAHFGYIVLTNTNQYAITDKGANL